MALLQDIATFLLDTLFPAFCIECQREGRYLCNECGLFLSETLPMCLRCKGQSFGGQTHPYCRTQRDLDGFVSTWDYEGVVKKAIVMLKERRVTHIVPEFVLKAGLFMVQDSLRFQQFLSFLLQPETVLVPIPMWRTKERLQGFDHSFLISSSLAGIIKKKVVSCLEKARNTVPQEEIGGIERLSNIQDSFRLKGQAPVQAVLVDDFLVSGATLKECCKILKQSGTRKIWGYTLARIP